MDGITSSKEEDQEALEQQDADVFTIANDQDGGDVQTQIVDSSEN